MEAALVLLGVSVFAFVGAILPLANVRAGCASVCERISCEGCPRARRPEDDPT